MNICNLEAIFGAQQDKPDGIRGILQTKNYNQFIIFDDVGNKIHEFEGAKLANKCLPGDHVYWTKECHLELRDEHPLIVGTIEFKTKYGFTKKHIPLYLFTPHNKSYPHFIVSCSYPTMKNILALITFDNWTTTFPRGHIEQVLGPSGEYDAEKQALIWQASPYRYPKGEYTTTSKETTRKELHGVTFNIDPIGCQDIDDVLTFEKVEEGWKVTITISDVAAYIESDSVVDIFASLIGQTLYDNGNAIRPMLPKNISENVCSLLPGKISHGISLQFLWTDESPERMRHIEWFESTFKNDKSYTYEEFDREDSEYKPILKEIATYLAKKDVVDSHGWIEQMMLFYNMEAGKVLKMANMGILRRHSAPTMEKVEKYPPELKFLAFSSAEYCLAEEESKHYGLNSEYAHMSSPIRRYADLVNQRVFKLRNSGHYIIPVTMYDMNTRAKRVKNFERNMCFLDAIQTNRTFKGIILDRVIKDDIKLTIYIHEWKRCISVSYKYDGNIWSRDEKREIQTDDIEINCTFNTNARNWKERVIINII